MTMTNRTQNPAFKRLSLPSEGKARDGADAVREVTEQKAVLSFVTGMS